MYNQVGTNVITVDLQDRNNLYKPTMGLFDAAKKPTVCGSDVTVLVEDFLPTTKTQYTASIELTAPIDTDMYGDSHYC